MAQFSDSIICRGSHKECKQIYQLFFVENIVLCNNSIMLHSYN
jgi:hypothetical protein